MIQVIESLHKKDKLRAIRNVMITTEHTKCDWDYCVKKDKEYYIYEYDAGKDYNYLLRDVEKGDNFHIILFGFTKDMKLVCQESILLNKKNVISLNMSSDIFIKNMCQ